jgi:hypothetical protein
MKKWILISAAVIAVTSSVYWVNAAFGAAGSGNSAENRDEDSVVICHYDRNQQGPNAGPHTITINRSALDHHLENHVKDEGFVGDDSLGPCPGDITPLPTFRPTSVPPTVAPD